MGIKPVTITVSHFSAGTPSLVGPLRLAIGLASAYRRYPVTVLLCDEGVLHALAERNPEWLDRYMTSAQAHGVKLWVDQESLESQGISSDLVHAAIESKGRDEFWEARQQASFNLSF